MQHICFVSISSIVMLLLRYNKYRSLLYFICRIHNMVNMLNVIMNPKRIAFRSSSVIFIICLLISGIILIYK